jgi:hypothetical protein
MNRFIIEDTPSKIASSLCDQHVVKMPLEEAQMLCTALWSVQTCTSEASMHVMGDGNKGKLLVRYGFVWSNVIRIY